jgi:palmitoyl transferase
MRYLFLPLLALTASLPLFADEPVADTESDSILPVRLWEKLKTNSLATWHTPDSHELYLPLFTWHASFAWDKDEREDYNENPWGAGYGLSRYDADGDWHGLYAMMFKDSHHNWQPIAGYAYEKHWHPLSASDDFHLGLGLTAGITMREEWSYLPVPILFPIGSVGYKQLTLQATYVPGTRNKGNVLFGWLRWEFD